MAGTGSAHAGLDAQHTIDGDDFESRRSKPIRVRAADLDLNQCSFLFMSAF
jgi:hypothetical protein